MKPIKPTLVALVFGLMVGACGPATPPTEMPTFTPQGHLRVVIERPAGTNHQVSYDPVARSFHVPEAETSEATFEFLPYPANYGFVPSTRSGSDLPGPVPALLLAESLPSAFAMEAKPLALLRLSRPGGERYWLLTIPAAPGRRLLPDSTAAQLQANHPAIREILDLWLINHRPQDSVQAVEWQDEAKALQWIEAHQQAAAQESP